MTDITIIETKIGFDVVTLEIIVTCEIGINCSYLLLAVTLSDYETLDDFHYVSWSPTLEYPHVRKTYEYRFPHTIGYPLSVSGIEKKLVAVCREEAFEAPYKFFHNGE